mgnify:CR=1 FL=1
MPPSRLTARRHPSAPITAAFSSRVSPMLDAARMKASKAHEVPLPPRALQMLEDLPRDASGFRLGQAPPRERRRTPWSRGEADTAVVEL